ncbi:AzlD domain-containing protein [Halosegnis marinus]|uniref:AzlD domain-containing protein n=1 Tax=Halosegnis marinus TaxID=3034023 RepID=A0ABD5ZQF4_9EURY|nr:AzlD domain-containing protein [Halosegnis sp. DT85]
MTATDAVVWAAVALGGVATFAVRASFVFLYERLDIPELAERALGYVPAAVLAALVVPAVLTLDGVPVAEAGLPPAEALRTLLGSDRVLAAGVAAVVAYYTEDVLATIVVGMGVLLALGAV